MTKGVLNPKVEQAPTAPDADLVARLRAGDDRAYEAFVRDHAGRLLAVALRMLGNETDAHDAVQEAFLSIFRSIGRFDGRSSLSTWSHRIVVNACLMKMRARRRRPEKKLEDLVPTFSGQYMHHDRPPVEWAVFEDRAQDQLAIKELVWKGLDQLPDTYREVIILRDIEGMDTEEAAEALGITREAVKQRLHRARQALLELLQPEMTRS